MLGVAKASGNIVFYFGFILSIAVLGIELIPSLILFRDEPPVKVDYSNR